MRRRGSARGPASPCFFCLLLHLARSLGDDPIEALAEPKEAASRHEFLHHDPPAHRDVSAAAFHDITPPDAGLALRPTRHERPQHLLVFPGSPLPCLAHRDLEPHVVAVHALLRRPSWDVLGDFGPVDGLYPQQRVTPWGRGALCTPCFTFLPLLNPSQHLRVLLFREPGTLVLPCCRMIFLEDAPASRASVAGAPQDFPTPHPALCVGRPELLGQLQEVLVLIAVPLALAGARMQEARAPSPALLRGAPSQPLRDIVPQTLPPAAPPGGHFLVGLLLEPDLDRPAQVQEEVQRENGHRA